MSRVNIILSLRQWLLRGLVNGEQIKLRPITLIEEKLVPNALNHNIPRINRPWSTHESGENSVGGKNRGFVLVCESAYNRVVGGGDFEEVPILETFEAAFVFGCDAIIGAIVVFESTAEEKVFRLGNCEGEFRERGERDLVVHVPFRLDIHRGFENSGFAARRIRV